MVKPDDPLGDIQELVELGILREVEGEHQGHRWEVLIPEGLPDSGWLSDIYDTYGDIRWY